MSELTLTISAHGREYKIGDPGGLIGEALNAGNPYEAPVLEHIFSRGFSGLAIDAGASMGNHTLWFAGICGLAVAAFEPLDSTRLFENVRRNPQLKDVIAVYPVALGESRGRAVVEGPPAHVVGGRLAGDGKVEVLRLDDLHYEGVALIKIDVEGMEPQVLRGARETIKRERPVIYAEATDQAAHDRNAEVLLELGYEHVNTFGATPLEEWEPC